MRSDPGHRDCASAFELLELTLEIPTQTSRSDAGASVVVHLKDGDPHPISAQLWEPRRDPVVNVNGDGSRLRPRPVGAGQREPSMRPNSEVRNGFFVLSRHPPCLIPQPVQLSVARCPLMKYSYRF